MQLSRVAHCVCIDNGDAKRFVGKEELGGGGRFQFFSILSSSMNAIAHKAINKLNKRDPISISTRTSIWFSLHNGQHNRPYVVDDRYLRRLYEIKSDEKNKYGRGRG